MSSVSTTDRCAARIAAAGEEQTWRPPTRLRRSLGGGGSRQFRRPPVDASHPSVLGLRCCRSFSRVVHNGEEWGWRRATRPPRRAADVGTRMTRARARRHRPRDGRGTTARSARANASSTGICARQRTTTNERATRIELAFSAWEGDRHSCRRTSANRGGWRRPRDGRGMERAISGASVVEQWPRRSLRGLSDGGRLSLVRPALTRRCVLRRSSTERAAREVRSGS
jgi:hypothetical protein